MHNYSKSMKNATTPLFRNHNRSALEAGTYITHRVIYYPLVTIMCIDIIFFTRTGFEPERIEAILHKIELSQKHQTTQFGLGLIAVSIFLLVFCQQAYQTVFKAIV